jgi:hypothetical protein
LDWVKQHDAGESAVAELPSLASGQAWVFSPQFLDVLTKIQFRRRRTFDSGATPKVGGRPRPPATLAAVDLAEIQQTMAETIERAAAEDPAALRRRIKQLEKELAAAQQTAEVAEPPAPVVERVEVPVIAQADLDRLADVVAQLQNQFDQQQQHLAAAQEASAHAVDQLQAIQATFQSLNSHPDPAQTIPPRPLAPPAAPPAPQTATDTDATAAAEFELRSGARRMIQALGRMWPLRLTKSQWGTVARLKTSGGTWSTYLSDIRRAGLLDETAAGYQLSDTGFAYLGGRPTPMSATELQDQYRHILRSGAAKMLDTLINAYPNSLSREKLGADAGLATTGGTFST